jgi:hypothetical protein
MAKKYLVFDPWLTSGKTEVWAVFSVSGDRLAIIKWYGAWRQYCFFPVSGAETVWSVGCLQEVTAFIEQLMAKRRG